MMVPGPLRRTWQIAPSVAVLIGLFVLPLSFLFVVSFWKKTMFQVAPDFVLDGYGRAVSGYWDVGLNTLAIAIGTGVATTALAFLFAYVIRFKAGRYGDILLFNTLVTLFGGYLVKIYAWKSILGRDGILNSALLALGLTSEPIDAFIYNPGAVIVALVHFLLPLAVLPIYAAMRNIRDITLEAGRDLGASSTQVLFGVVLPQCRAGLVAAFAFSFLIAAGDYITPLFLGGTGGAMIGMFIANQFSIRFDWPLGSAMAFLVMFVSLSIVLVVRLAILRRPR
ncbi:MAG TPA: ABC transporter permease [Alphaproteobacteria bacterium]|nr:ABC transporter permease [Alphaproteobacteria bacterium]